MKLIRAILKFQRRFSRAQLVFRGHVPEAKMFPRLISNNGKRKIRKNRFGNVLEFFENLSEIAFLDFDFTEWAELALSNFCMKFRDVSGVESSRTANIPDEIT